MTKEEMLSNANDINLIRDGHTSVDFCKLWPDVKPGLELLQKVLKDPIAQAAVALVINAGDAVSSKICH
jgi:hypothetical protein